MQRSIVESDKAPQPVGPYSQAIKANGLLYLSGQIPLDPQTGELVTESFDLQVRTVLNTLTAVLQAGGSGLDRVVKVTIFLTDMNRFQEMNAIYAEYFGRSQPARACVEVRRLPRDAPIEIEAVALAD